MKQNKIKKNTDKKKLKFIIQLIRGMLSYKNINNNNFYQ